MFRNLLKTSLKLPKSINFNLVSKRNAGHSKWQNIRHIKGAKDAERSKLFTKISRQIKVAIQEGGSFDPKLNLKLSQVLEQAKRANMPNQTVQSVIKACQQDKTGAKPHMFEIKGPGSCFILCEVFSSNVHHLQQSIATILRKNGAKFSDGGGIHYFDEKGIIEADILETDKKLNEKELQDKITGDAIEAGAEEVHILSDNQLQFTCGKTNLNACVLELEKLKYNISSASVEFIPNRTQSLTDSELQMCGKLYDKLEELPEVVRISDNIA